MNYEWPENTPGRSRRIKFAAGLIKRQVQMNIGARTQTVMNVYVCGGNI